jgi:hypothetical protein
MTEKEAIRDHFRGVKGFRDRELGDQIVALAWFLHSYCKKETFTTADIRRCLRHLEIPIPFYKQLDLHQFRGGILTGPQDGKLHIWRDYYKLHWRIREQFEQEELAGTPTSIQVHQLLKELPDRLPLQEEKAFLEETLTCYRSGANRAAIVMCWNLAFSHLCNFILNDTSRLTAFNQGLLKKFKNAKAINAYDDFSSFRESEVLELCNLAKIITKNKYNTLKGRLNQRNAAAHPSTESFTQVNAEDYITDLINNIILALHVAP